MKSGYSPDVTEVLTAVKYQPSVTILVSVESHANRLPLLQQNLKRLMQEAEMKLRFEYPEEIVSLVMQKLRNLADHPEPEGDIRGIALFASPVFQKFVFLSTSVESSVTIGDTFQIRELIRDAKNQPSYLLLLLSGTHCRLLRGTGNKLTELPEALPSSINEVVLDIPNRAKDYSDQDEKKEVIMHKYLRIIDQALHKYVSSSSLPVFIFATHRVAGHFKSITQHKSRIAATLPGNFICASYYELSKALKPLLKELTDHHHEDLLKRLEAAAGSQKLLYGIHEVWRAAGEHKGSLLVVEKDFSFSAQHGRDPYTLYNADELPNRYNDISDAVDDVMEQVLSTGGDVEFVEDGTLNEYGKIALITYY